MQVYKIRTLTWSVWCLQVSLSPTQFTVSRYNHQNVKETALALKKNLSTGGNTCCFKYEFECRNISSEDCNHFFESQRNGDRKSFWWAQAAQLHWSTGTRELMRVTVHRIYSESTGERKTLPNHGNKSNWKLQALTWAALTLVSAANCCWQLHDWRKSEWLV